MKLSLATSADRLSLCLLAAVVAHAAVILGVGFSGRQDPAPSTPPLIEVTLAERPTLERPDEYDFLAQADQEGGGDNERAERPRRPQKMPALGLPEGDHPLPETPLSASAPPAGQHTAMATAREADFQVFRPEQAASDPEALAPEVEQQAPNHIPKASEFLDLPDADRSRAPSVNMISPRTRADSTGAYVHGWVEKVEQVGNLNYPDEARRQRMSGRVELEVILRPDGHLHSLRVLRSSGQPLLDQTAQRIVQLAAPYEPIPLEALEGRDMLGFTRAFDFIHGDALQAR